MATPFGVAPIRATVGCNPTQANTFSLSHDGWLYAWIMQCAPTECPVACAVLQVLQVLHVLHCMGESVNLTRTKHGTTGYTPKRQDILQSSTDPTQRSVSKREGSCIDSEVGGSCKHLSSSGF